MDTAPLVLLVDDDPDCLELARPMLEGAGYRVRCCAGPGPAWQALQEERPALVITDLMMDTADAGFALARRIKAADPAQRVLVLTAVGRQLGLDFLPRADGDLAAMGADAFLEKPVRRGPLLAAVRRLLPDR